MSNINRKYSWIKVDGTTIWCILNEPGRVLYGNLCLTSGIFPQSCKSSIVLLFIKKQALIKKF